MHKLLIRSDKYFCTVIPLIRNNNDITFTIPHFNTHCFVAYSIGLQCISTWNFFSKQFSKKQISELSVSIFKKKMIAKY